MRGKVLYIRDADYDFLINSFIIFDGQTFESKIPKGYHVVKEKTTQTSQTVYLSKKQNA